MERNGTERDVRQATAGKALPDVCSAQRSKFDLSGDSLSIHGLAECPSSGHELQRKTRVDSADIFSQRKTSASRMRINSTRFLSTHFSCSKSDDFTLEKQAASQAGERLRQKRCTFSAHLSYARVDRERCQVVPQRRQLFLLVQSAHFSQRPHRRLDRLRLRRLDGLR